MSSEELHSLRFAREKTTIARYLARTLRVGLWMETILFLLLTGSSEISFHQALQSYSRSYVNALASNRHFLLKPSVLLKSLGNISKNSLKKRKWILVSFPTVSTCSVDKNSMVRRCEPGSVMSAKRDHPADVNARFMSWRSPVIIRNSVSNRLSWPYDCFFSSSRASRS